MTLFFCPSTDYYLIKNEVVMDEPIPLFKPNKKLMNKQKANE